MNGVTIISRRTREKREKMHIVIYLYRIHTAWVSTNLWIMLLNGWGCFNSFTPLQRLSITLVLIGCQLSSKMNQSSLSDHEVFHSEVRYREIREVPFLLNLEISIVQSSWIRSSKSNNISYKQVRTKISEIKKNMDKSMYWVLSLD